MSVTYGSTDDDRQLTRYLLGLLSEEDTERIEESTIVDDDAACRLRAVENDLVDAYVRRTLPDDAVRPFEVHYLASTRRRAKVRFATSFARAVDAVDAADAWYTRFLPHAISPRARLAAAAATVLILALGAWIVRDVRHARQPPPAGQKVESLRAPSDTASGVTARDRLRGTPATDGKASPSIASNAGERTEATAGSTSLARSTLAVVVLLPQTRSSDEVVPTVSVTRDAERVMLELRLDVADFPRYAATLKDSAGRTIWRGEPMAATVVGDQPTVSVVVPAKVLSSQTYALDLSGVSAPSAASGGDREAIATYVFSVIRRR